MKISGDAGQGVWTLESQGRSVTRTEAVDLFSDWLEERGIKTNPSKDVLTVTGSRGNRTYTFNFKEINER